MIESVKQRVLVEPAQTAMILSLQSMLQASGLILVCPQCLGDGRSNLHGDVSIETPIWHLTCDCRDRVMERKDAKHRFDADGDLIASADTVLNPLRLAVRCPEPSCLTHPLEMTRTETKMEVRCRCAKTTFPLPSSLPH